MTRTTMRTLVVLACVVGLATGCSSGDDEGTNETTEAADSANESTTSKGATETTLQRESGGGDSSGDLTDSTEGACALLTSADLSAVGLEPVKGAVPAPKGALDEQVCIWGLPDNGRVRVSLYEDSATYGVASANPGARMVTGIGAEALFTEDLAQILVLLSDDQVIAIVIAPISEAPDQAVFEDLAVAATANT